MDHGDFSKAQRMEAIGRLAGGLAHDLNNRLMVITGRARFALEELPESSPVRVHVEEIRQAADRASSVIRQLLAFGRRGETRLTWLILNDVIAAMAELVDRLIGDKVTLTLELGAGLWPVIADRTQVELAILNLAMNAKEAMHGGGTLTIGTSNMTNPTLSASAPTHANVGDFVRLWVKDTGLGMDATTLAHAFDPFFTTHDMATRSGLGLTAVYGIMQQVAGMLDVESVLHSGTTLSLYFPRAENLPPSMYTTSHDHTKRHDPVSTGKTVLVVDDDSAIRALIRLALESRGYRVIDACSGHDALLLSEIQRTPVDLLVTDISMRAMGGNDLAAQMLERFATLRVLFMSGHVEDELVTRGVLRAGEPFLQKPFGVTELGDMVATVLDTPSAPQVA